MKRAGVALAAVLVLVLTGCGGSRSAAEAGATPDGQKLTVFAAASLKGAFTRLGESFQSAHPGVEVSFNFAGSADLVSQLQSGAPADVFASADTRNMAKATTANLVAGTAENFAANTLEIAVPPDNPAGVRSFRDLARSGVQVVVCAPQVPCGSATRTVEQATGVTITPVSEEQSVTDVLNKVVSGEADAGLVYVTDVKAAGDKVRGITFPESSSAVNVYPIATLEGSPHQDLARQFVDLVTGPDGQQVLADAGFARP